ncbi:unnamed protein product, partial [Prorocentrum cordatum]
MHENPARMLNFVVCSQSFQVMLDRVSAEQIDLWDYYGVWLHIKGDAEEAFEFTEEERGALWQVKYKIAKEQNRRVWRSPPDYVKAAATNQFDCSGAGAMGAPCGSWAHAVEQFYVAALVPIVSSFADEVVEWAPRTIYAATVLWGLAVFCDTPEPLLILGERLAREGAARAELAMPDRSLCAGARGGIGSERVVPCAALEEASGKFRCARARVGDVTAGLMGSMAAVIKPLTGAWACFAPGGKMAQLVLPTASAVIGDDEAAVQEIALELRSRDIAVKFKGRAADLGIDRSSVGGWKGKRAVLVARASRQVERAAGVLWGGRGRGGEESRAPRGAMACALLDRGAGLGRGAGPQSSWAVMRELRGKGQRETAGALWAILSGAAWPRKRASDLGAEVAGWVVLGSARVEPMFVAGGRGGLTWWRQSVHRGELMALQELLIYATGFWRTGCIADSRCAVRGVAEVGAGRALQTQWDLWEIVNSGTCVFNSVGNELADRCAEDLAGQVQASAAQARAVRWLEGIAEHIGKRANAAEWLEGDCVEAMSSIASPPGALQAPRTRVGNQPAHLAHKTEFDRTLEVHCAAKCGAIAKETVKGLAKPCVAPIKQAGMHNLARTESGLMFGGVASMERATSSRGEPQVAVSGGDQHTWYSLRAVDEPEGRAWDLEMMVRKTGFEQCIIYPSPLEQPHSSEDPIPSACSSSSAISKSCRIRYRARGADGEVEADVQELTSEIR